MLGCLLGLRYDQCFAVPVRLRVEQQTSPLAIDAEQPRFSWQSDARTAGWMQGGYEILVAQDETKLQRGDADVWRSGRIASSDSINIAYGGPALQSRTRYWWSVTVWDTQGRKEISSAAWFETGPGAGDWTASGLDARTRRANAS